MNSDNSSYENLYTDDSISSSDDHRVERVVGISLVHCVLLVLIKDKQIVFAWHCAGMDLGLVLNPDMNDPMMKLLLGSHVPAAENRMHFFKDMQKSYKGTQTYAFGPHADDVIAKYFDCKCYRTDISPCDVFVDASCMKAKFTTSGDKVGSDDIEDFDLI
jgi:hypothetical protein